MDIIFERLINDFHENELTDFTHRHIEVSQIQGKVDAIIGMRRTGKTVFVYQMMAHLMKQGIKKQQLLYINFEDDRLISLQAKDLSKLTDVFYRLYPELKDQRCYLFFDEIQTAPEWERYVRRLIDTENVQITITGSSSKLLSKEIATSLRGRSIATEVFPFNFTEVLEHEKISYNNSNHFGSKKIALLLNRFQRYLTQGGFPEVQGLKPQIQHQLLQEYVDIVILRDIVERHKVTNIQPLRALINHVLSSPSTLFSVNKFFNSMKTMGIKCGKNTLYDFLGYLNDAYLIFQVSIYSQSERIKRVNPTKIYAVDTGLSFCYSHAIHPDWWRLLENFIYLHLRKQHFNIAYYKTKNGQEVDFIIRTWNGEQWLIQVSWQIDQQQTRQREISALSAAMIETGIKLAFIITFNQQEIIQVESGQITVIPAWKWCLGDFRK